MEPSTAIVLTLAVSIAVILPSWLALRGIEKLDREERERRAADLKGRR